MTRTEARATLDAARGGTGCPAAITAALIATGDMRESPPAPAYRPPLHIAQLMHPTATGLDLTRAAVVYGWLRGNADATRADVCAALGMTAKAAQRAIKPLVDAGLVLVREERVGAGELRPPGTAYFYGLAADPVLPDWLPTPDEPSRPERHGAIVACALAHAAPSVWAWRPAAAGIESGRAA